MTVFVNEEPLRLFRGANVGDAIMKYSESIFRDILSRRKVVTNATGKALPLQGDVHDGDRFVVTSSQ
ncbi:hypothetical protein OKW21_004782 [Catalinimonas alkaloidigena]|uniref:hypothetical protein n=1 Tax=Catalinimonas alkaloidigena TaxID=1075417 RepID=UPI0024072F7F|nr:hypothetical protein [Catalinimonas alkaloidigena]MDF9799519.1 hypothetical protein [Catalinimonas alkaloidigena]